ncbi:MULTISPECIES: 2-phospho-L-lactate guanylyltransferase [Agrobacterium]|uniref:3-phospho-D-glycerate guanylyltransferase n=1 Tax=Agrobacterium rubi TaxID=28099 RepID=A0AAE7R7U6_9HYPH|nr:MULTISPECIES: 2-phospho-L-lactate guanylyltransferase [Agrobacterium]MBN7808938.1 2-phospho-L-lactate guanylyltransferase [Agrobacterium rosae]NTE89860.1 2-phospho-L-lactate guanylyltransferase [Agrobacterium rubi]NTF05290.1 2-phospho-L-lactate guanylyltransferase [Agrobacterium rubi]NTF10536.1 2-phospho-L-lactate guanylyltransferase [Agrobacterium rubi]NTF22930.1 2-phospho-L-lactate guanylyltransferase [Agrobacterium rubi]
MSNWVLVPIKRSEQAKSRLSPLLDREERQALVHAMARDVFGALTEASSIAGVGVVSPDAEILRDANALGFHAIPDLEEIGYAAAVARGVAALSMKGATDVLAIPGDLPLLTARDIDHLVEAHRGARFTIISSRDGKGTNGLMQRLPAKVPFLYGNESYSRHIAAAGSLGISANVVFSKNLALDIDYPEDVQAFLSVERETATRAALLSMPTVLSSYVGNFRERMLSA